MWFTIYAKHLNFYSNINGSSLEYVLILEPWNQPKYIENHHGTEHVKRIFFPFQFNGFWKSEVLEKLQTWWRGFVVLTETLITVFPL